MSATAFVALNAHALREILVQGGAVSAGTLRLSRMIARQFGAEQQHSVWLSPQVSTMDVWIRHRWLEFRVAGRAAEALIDETQAELLWEEVLADLPVEASLRSRVAARAQRARAALLRWQVDLSDSSVRAAFAEEPDCADFPQRITHFQELCRSRNALTVDDAALKLLESGASSSLTLAGFVHRPPLYHALASRELGIEGPSAAPVLCACQDPRDELVQAALWCRQRIEQAPDVRLGVCVFDLAARRDDIERVFDEIFDGLCQPDGAPYFEFSLGQPLTETPLVATAFRVLQLTLGLVRREELQALLRSPFIAVFEKSPDQQAKLFDRLARSRKDEFDQDEIAAVLRLSPENNLAQTLAACPPFQKAAPSAWARLFFDQLERFGWPRSRPLNSVEHQQKVAWDETLERFAGLDWLCGKITARQALARLRRIADKHIFQPERAPGQILISEPMAAAGLRFDALWLVGANERNLPASARPLPFIPRVLQRTLGIGDAADNLAALASARHLFAALSCGAGELIASCALLEDGESIRQSPLLRDAADWPHHGGQKPPGWLARRDPEALERIDAGHGYTEGEPLWDDCPGGSSLITDQSACPFRAWASHRLRARPVDPPLRGLDPAERGTLVHEALNYLWLELGESVDLLARSSELKALIARAVDKALADCVEDGARLSAQLSRVFLAEERARLQRLLSDWMAEELYMLRDKLLPPFAIEALEQECARVRAGVRLKLRADRIDRLENGALRVVDYKTGQVSERNWDGDRPEAPQLPLYALVYGEDEQPIEEIVFAKLAPRIKERTSGKFLSQPSWISRTVDEAQRAEFARVIDALFDGFVKARAEVSPRDAKVCRNCKLGSLCRIGEKHGD